MDNLPEVDRPDVYYCVNVHVARMGPQRWVCIVHLSGDQSPVRFHERAIYNRPVSHAGGKPISQQVAALHWAAEQLELIARQVDGSPYEHA